MYVVGTAGHVDHGKSTLVQALTGINPDRLREERERQMTIDLGFAWMTLPSGEQISLVDVPGHEDFVRNMLAGIGGVDVALLVVAADESVMPQTREHLAILDLLGVTRGVVALTKIDTVEDEEWLALVEDDVRDLLRGTGLAACNIVPMSAVTGQGLDLLRAELDRILAETPPRRDIQRPRLPVDRVFSLSGFGTVVTGTLSDGSFSDGETVAIMPGRQQARIRGIQTHKTNADRVTPGARVAMNLGGVGTDDISRGQVITWPDTYRATRMIDASLRVLDDVPQPVEHDDAFDLHVGSSRVTAHVRLLDAESVAAGEQALVQLRLSEPVVVARGDRFVVRQPSPSQTVGGGEVLYAHPARRYRRFDDRVLDMLRRLRGDDPGEVLYALLGARRALLASELVALSDITPSRAHAALEALVETGRVVVLGSDDVVREGEPVALATAESWDQTLSRLEQALADYHERSPLRSGMSREELRSRMRVDASLLSGILDRAVREGRIRQRQNVVSLTSFQATLSSEQAGAAETLLQSYADQPYTPPTLSQAEETVGADVVAYLIEAGRLEKVAQDLLYAPEARADLEQMIVTYLRQHGEITVAQTRDLMKASRRYALGLLEDLDRRRVTRRIGDVRVLRGAAQVSESGAFEPDDS